MKRVEPLPALLELLAQENLKFWPCVCGDYRPTERDLLCWNCWVKIPEAKRRGLGFLDKDTEEYRLACEQILRIANRNLGHDV